MAAIAFYVEEADGIELIIHSGLQEILNQEKQVNIYRLREYSCTDCYVYLPVSYTHLDVYKRQRMECSLCGF